MPVLAAGKSFRGFSSYRAFKSSINPTLVRLIRNVKSARALIFPGGTARSVCLEEFDVAWLSVKVG